MITRAWYHRVILTLFWFSVFLSLSTPALSEVTLKPLLISTIRLEDNYFLAENNEHEVLTYLLQPGVDLGYTEANSQAKLHYTLDNFFYDDQESDLAVGELSADEDDFTGHTLNVSGRYRAFKRLLLGIEDDFYVTRDPAQSDQLSNSISREKYTLNRIAPMIFYDFGDKFTAGLRYRNTIYDYSSELEEDSTLNTGIVDLIYNMNRTLALDVEYQHSEMDYDLTTSDYSSDQIKLILRKTFRLIAVDVGAGYNNRSFDETDNDDDDIDGLVYHFNINTASDLLAGPKLQFNYDTNYNDIGNTRDPGDSYYLAQRFTLRLTYDLSKKLTTGIGGYYQLSDYIKNVRKDKTIDLSANIGYALTRWLTASLTAGFANRDSNVSGYDYDNAYGFAALNVSHDFGKK